MKSLFSRVVAVLLLLCSVVAAAESGFDGLPACAQKCLTTRRVNSTCASITDTSCICNAAPLLSSLQECVDDACTRREALTSMHTVDIACRRPMRNHSDMYRVVISIFFSLAFLAIVARFVTRFTVGRTLWYDDATMGAVFVVNLALYIVGMKMGGTGLGKDIWTLQFDKINETLFYFWLSELLYFGLCSLVKVPFLLFYLTIFPEKSFRKIVWIMVAINVAMGASFVIATALSCHPVNFTWHLWDHEHIGKCFNINAMAFAHAAFGIVLDLITLLLPVTQIWSLQLPTKKKIGVLLMFSVGALVTLVSILRLRSLIHFANTQNMTWDYLEASLWSLIESNIGIICACMPAMRLGFIRAFPNIHIHLGSSREPAASNTNKASGQGAKSFSSAGYGGMQGTRTGRTRADNEIEVQTTYRVEHTRRPQINDEASFVQLVEIEADTKSLGSDGQKEARHSEASV